MKKIIVTYIAFMLPVLMWAQGYSNADKAAINGRIDTLLQNYLQKSGLTLPGVSKRNDKVVADLRAMIKTDAEIFDDINAAYNEKTHQYELKTKSRNTFIEDLVDRFPKGLLITNNNMNISYRDFDKNEIQVALSRTVQGTSSDKFTFYNEDTLLLTIGILPDQTVKIINISSIGSHLKCMNDKDNDGVIDETDECPEELGVIALNGCADADEDGIPDKRDHCPREKGTENNDGCPPSTFAYKLVFSGGIGTVFNSNKLESEMPVSALKGYDDLNEEQSQLGGIVTPSQRKASVHYHANVGYYFGKTSNKTKGISLGVSFSHYSASYNVGGLKFFYRKNQPGTQDNYHQIDLLSAAAVEEVDFSLLNFPLMFRYKTKFSQKLAAELSAGPSLLIMSMSSVLNNGSIDYGMIYAYDNAGTNRYTSGGYSASSNDWIVTREYLLNQNGQSTSQAIDYADDLYSKGYNVGFNLPVGNTEAVNSRTSLGLNANVDIFYHLGPKTAIKFGVLYVQSATKGNNDDYRMAGGRSESINYTSVFSSDIESKYSAYGFNLGLIIGLY